MDPEPSVEPPVREYEYVLQCPCGTTLRAPTEDEIVEVSFAHLRAEHPDLAPTYGREHVLFMAVRLLKG
ncbi:MAG: hypothetical protein KDB10_02510 [Acidimicrobiales bacterium]|nr:hypothetical protein [Acidimicrobiales bacterium]